MSWEEKVSTDTGNTASSLLRIQNAHACERMIEQALTDPEYTANKTLLHGNLTKALVTMRQTDPSIPPSSTEQFLKATVRRVAAVIANSSDGKTSLEYMKPHDIYPILQLYMEDELERLAARGELYRKHQEEIEARATKITTALSTGFADKSGTYLERLELKARDMECVPEKGVIGRLRQKVDEAKEAVTGEEKAELSPKTAARVVQAAIRQMVKDSSQELGYPQKLMDRKKEHFVKWADIEHLSANPKQLHAMMEPYVEKEIERMKLILVDKDPLAKPPETHEKRLLYTGPIGETGLA